MSSVPFEEETCWKHSEHDDSWYFHLHPKSQADPPVFNTQSLGTHREVNIDWGENGQIIGVEVL